MQDSSEPRSSAEVLVKKRFDNRNCLLRTEERSKEATNTAP